MAAEQSLSEKRPHSASPEDEHDDAQVPRRQRSREACAPCRQRKRKCNGRLPCDTCVRYEYKCEYTTPGRPSISQAELSNHDDPNQGLSATAQTLASNTKCNIIKLQAHPLTAPGARFHHRGMLDPLKTRFVRANSAIAFPRILGMEFESENVPRLHSFAWNLGIRPECEETISEITALLSWPEFQHLSALFFKIVRPEIGLLDESDFTEQASNRFANASGYSDFDAVILGVASLGSFFSETAHPREADFLIESRRSLVQKSLNRSPTSNHVAGWILRTLYLRLTSRPHASWITSCVALHQAEACGLHKEMQTIAVVYPAAPQGDHKLAKARRRMFWVARALNIILSFEFGRSRVNFEVITTRRFAAEPNCSAHLFVELAELLPNDFVDRDREPDPPAALSSALTRLEDLCPTSSSSDDSTSTGSSGPSPFIRLLKADLAFGIYRRLWLMSLTDAKDRSETVIKLGRAALSASQTLLEQGIAWWNVVGTPFQFVCVLLAIGTPKALEVVRECVELLGRIEARWDTHMVREAHRQAVALVAMARKRKEKELLLLGQSLGTIGEDVTVDGVSGDEKLASSSSTANAGTKASRGGSAATAQASASLSNGSDAMTSPAWTAPSGGSMTPVGMTEAPNIDWAEDLPFAWDMFLNPDLVISQQQGYNLQGNAAAAAAAAAGMGTGLEGMPPNGGGGGGLGGGQAGQQQAQQGFGNGYGF